MKNKVYVEKGISRTNRCVKFKVFIEGEYFGYILKDKSDEISYSSYIKTKFDSEYVSRHTTFFSAKAKLIELYHQNYTDNEPKSDNYIKLLPEGSNKNFFPTPSFLAGKMYKLIDWKRVNTILEPSAGKGDLLKNINKTYEFISGYIGTNLDIDCIEIDKNLQYILTGEKYRVVFDDFLSFKTFKRYDLIIMNPPFDKGCKHLLKAISLQQNGGQICCLLNAETLRNPYSNNRKILLETLERYNAAIEYLPSMFKNSQRKSDVEIAIVYLNIENKADESEFFQRMEKAEEIKDDNYSVPKEMVIGDFLTDLICRYKIEVKSGLKFIREYKALSPYILSSKKEKQYNKPIIELKIRGDNSLNANDFLKSVRYKYWEYLLLHQKFTGKLTSELRGKYCSLVSDMQNYAFNMFNIEKILIKIHTEMIQGVEDTICKLFLKMTQEHTWYPECSKNKLHYDGWKTNKAHKVGNKVILPNYGMFDKWDNKLDIHAANSLLFDLEKSFNYLSGESDSSSYINRTLQSARNNGITKNIEFKYFFTTFYKKGTVHLKFKNTKLIDMLNIYAGKKENGYRLLMVRMHMKI